MGHCGCADGFGHYKLRAIGGWYTIRLYAGCVDCDTPIGVDVSFVGDDSALMNCIEGITDITEVLHRREAAGDTVYLAVFDQRQLAKSSDLEEIAEPSEYETVRDLVSDLNYAIHQVAVATINKTLQTAGKED